MTEDEAWRLSAAEMVRRLGRLPPEVARAMRSVPRHRFVPAALQGEAYRDEPLPISEGPSTISAPHMVAIQLEWLELAPGFKVLEVGAGLGYLAALVAETCGPSGRVFAMEIDPELAREAERRLHEAGYGARVQVRAGDGSIGWPEQPPFDRIVISCATPSILPAWKAQLAEGGLVVAPVGDSWDQLLVSERKRGGKFTRREGPRCRFVGIRGSVQIPI
ncbi:MAG: protein-L-isoaspartate O-methyltransferase [Thermoplasmata archaeon]|nr:protein-L-isoaspartate O-methyltransferase [Thermoplasmata archaeon]